MSKERLSSGEEDGVSQVSTLAELTRFLEGNESLAKKLIGMLADKTASCECHDLIGAILDKGFEEEFTYLKVMHSSIDDEPSTLDGITLEHEAILAADFDEVDLDDPLFEYEIGAFLEGIGVYEELAWAFGEQLSWQLIGTIAGSASETVYGLYRAILADRQLDYEVELQQDALEEAKRKAVPILANELKKDIEVYGKSLIPLALKATAMSERRW